MSVALTFIENQLEMERLELQCNANTLETKMRGPSLRWSIGDALKRDFDEFWYALPQAIRDRASDENSRSLAFAMKTRTAHLERALGDHIRRHRVKFEEILCILR